MEMNLFCDYSTGFGLASARSSTLFRMQGITALESSQVSSEPCRTKLLDLQMVVFTIKLPDTDFVLVMERAARKNTFDFE